MPIDQNSDFSHLFGKWDCVAFDSDNLDKYLAQLGLSWALRKVGKRCSQTIAINSSLNHAKTNPTTKTDQPGLHIITSTTVTTTDDVFYFTVPRNVITKDGRKSTVVFKIKSLEEMENKNLEELEEEDQEDLRDIEEEKNLKSSADFKVSRHKIYLHKQEKWTDSKGIVQTAKITMKITDSGQMYARMSCNGIVVRRLHNK